MERQKLSRTIKRIKLSRYLVTEILPPFFLGIAVFTAILMIARILKLVELVVTRGVSFWQIAKLISLISPTFLELTVPMAFLLAILLALGRLAGDQEIIALKASGISPMQILVPVAALALVVSSLTLGLTLFGRPASQRALGKELYNIAKLRLGAALKEKVFNDDFAKILIYVEELVPPGNTAKGILIVDRRDPKRDDIILAKVAFIFADEATNNLGLKLFDGSVYGKEKTRPGFSQTRFNLYHFKLDLDELVAPIKRKDAGPKEASYRHLRQAIDDKQLKGDPAIAERMELHQRFAFAVVPLVFCFLGVALILLPRSSRASRSWAFSLCLFWLLFYYVLLSLGKALGDKGFLQPAAALWLPNVVVGAVASHVFFRAVKESPLMIQAWLDNGLAWTGKVLTGFRRNAQA